MNSHSHELNYLFAEREKDERKLCELYINCSSDAEASE